MARFSGSVTLSQVELQTQSWYFAFQVIQVFVLTTCTSTATSVISLLSKNPGYAPLFLATNLPKASNFYISYFILFGLSVSISLLRNCKGIINLIIFRRILPIKTPRQMFNKLVKLPAPKWGSEFPKWANLGVITLAYSTVAPLILGCSLISFSLVYVAFRYEFLYCYDITINT
jgi:hypothetical protein